MYSSYFIFFHYFIEILLFLLYQQFNLYLFSSQLPIFSFSNDNTLPNVMHSLKYRLYVIFKYKNRDWHFPSQIHCRGNWFLVIGFRMIWPQFLQPFASISMQLTQMVRERQSAPSPLHVWVLKSLRRSHFQAKNTKKKKKNATDLCFKGWDGYASLSWIACLVDT